MGLTMDNYHMERVYSSCGHSEADELYFEWLCEMVDGNDYCQLLSHLHTIPFVWLIPNDDNRLSDGLSLRQMFCNELSYNRSCEQLLGDDPCSVLEMLVALAIRMADMVADPEEDIHVGRMFFEMIGNLDLTRYNDRNYIGINDCKDKYAHQALSQDMAFVDHKINIFLSRQYKTNGSGGAFPLLDPRNDQRKVELWYQMNTYLMENYFYEI